jgi:hypothetical protein
MRIVSGRFVLDLAYGDGATHAEVFSSLSGFVPLERREHGVGRAGLAYWFVLRVCHHERVPGQPWSLVQLQPALRLRAMPNQVEHKGSVKLAKPRKVA